MSDKDDVYTDIAHHFGGDFARVCAFVGKAADILGAGVDFVLQNNLHGIMYLREIDGGRADADADAVGGGKLAQLVDKAVVVVKLAVHFPVADNPFLLPDVLFHCYLLMRLRKCGAA